MSTLVVQREECDLERVFEVIEIRFADISSFFLNTVVYKHFKIPSSMFVHLCTVNKKVRMVKTSKSKKVLVNSMSFPSLRFFILILYLNLYERNSKNKALYNRVGSPCQHPTQIRPISICEIAFSENIYRSIVKRSSIVGFMSHSYSSEFL